MKIVADTNIPFVREAFGSFGDVFLLPGRQITKDALRKADVLLVRSVTPINAALLEGTAVKFVGNAAAGLDHIDKAYLASRGIGLASATGANANSVAEYVVAAMLELADQRGFRLRDKTLGVIGVGHVGSRVVRFAEALGMRVLQNDPPRQQTENLPELVSLDRVLADADIVTLHVPLLETTRHMFHRDNLQNFLLINTARGAVVDNLALLRAIDADRIPGVVLDVWENEPNISPELLDVVDLGTPHIAGYSFDARLKGTQQIYRTVCDFFKVAATWQLEASEHIQKISMKIGADADDEDVLRQIVRKVYEIRNDDRALRKNPRDFDRLRAEYTIRREFFNAELALLRANDRLLTKCETLGFRVDSGHQNDFSKRT